jgi:hypothetical protein
VDEPHMGHCDYTCWSIIPLSEPLFSGVMIICVLYVYVYIYISYLSHISLSLLVLGPC